MKPTFEKTIDILVKAYLNDTLFHGNCAACAVGNIIASSIGATVEVNDFEWRRRGVSITPIWDNVFCSSSPGDQDVNPESYKGWEKRQIDVSGYSWQELAKIELAFELCNPTAYDTLGDVTDRAMFDGLMNVVDVLAEIHNVDLSVREEAKLLFAK